MGKICEKITLTNATDESLVRRGQMSPGHIHRITVEGIVDAAAVRSVLPLQIVKQLGLEIRGQQMVQYADERSEAVPVTGGVIFECQARQTLEEALVLGSEVLIGQTVVEKLDLLADCTSQRLMPHPGRPNQPMSMLRRQNSIV